MKTQVRFFMLLAASCFLLQGIALAEMVQGQVTAVNVDDRSLTVQRMDPTKGQEQIKVSVPEDTEFRGIQSLDEVEVGDEIRAEAKRPSLGIGSWEAQWIEKADGSGAGMAQSGAREQGAQSESARASKPSAGY